MTSRRWSLCPSSCSQDFFGVLYMWLPHSPFLQLLALFWGPKGGEGWGPRGGEGWGHSCFWALERMDNYNCISLCPSSIIVFVHLAFNDYELQGAHKTLGLWSSDVHGG